uniref:hypothetical protein n=1 Tax=Streptomyces sp. CA-136453 TaxID=3240050 RepID=UPI003F494379
MNLPFIPTQGGSHATLDSLYPPAAWQLPVNPALPAPRLPAPPVERQNHGDYREYYGRNVLAELDVAGRPERLAVINKAWPHSLFDVMLLVADPQTVHTGVGDTADPTLTALLHAAHTYVRFLSQPDTVRHFDLAGAQLVIGFNHDRTLDRDNGQWWDKTMHWHLNVWPRSVRTAVRPHRLVDIHDTTLRRSLVDPCAYLAHQVMADALARSPLPDGCRILPPDPTRDAARGLPVGLKVRLPHWRFTTTAACVTLLHTLHDTAEHTYAALRQAFTGSPAMCPAWQRPPLLPTPRVAEHLAALDWLSPAARHDLLRLRLVLRDVTDRELRLLAGRRDLANRSLTLGGLSYNLSLVTPDLIAAAPILADTDELYLVMQLKLVSYVGHSPAVGGAVASTIDRHHGPLLTGPDRRTRHDFQHAYLHALTRTPAPALTDTSGGTP